MHTAKNDLGAIIKRHRLNKKLTQEALSEKAGCGNRHIMAIENEGSSPSYELLSFLIRELNIDANEIFHPGSHTDDSQLAYLNRLLGRCTPRDIAAVTALVETFLSETE